MAFTLTPTMVAVPLFAAMIAAEAWWSTRHGSDEYNDKKDTWGNILLGFGSIVWGGLFALVTINVYIFCYELAPYKFPADAWWTWVALFFVDDLGYYIFHRVSHESRGFWKFNVVHHSSEYFNLAPSSERSKPLVLREIEDL